MSDKNNSDNLNNAIELLSGLPQHFALSYGPDSPISVSISDLCSYLTELQEARKKLEVFDKVTSKLLEVRKNFKVD
jgi:hypothetical protein